MSTFPSSIPAEWQDYIREPQRIQGLTHGYQIGLWVLVAVLIVALLGGVIEFRLWTKAMNKETDEKRYANLIGRLLAHFVQTGKFEEDLRRGIMIDDDRMLVVWNNRRDKPMSRGDIVRQVQQDEGIAVRVKFGNYTPLTRDELEELAHKYPHVPRSDGDSGSGV